eukprot:s2144_g4.t1
MACVHGASIKALAFVTITAMTEGEASEEAQQDMAAAAEEEMQAERKLEQSTEDFRARLARLSSQPPSLETKALLDNLGAAKAQLAEDERRLRLDQELRAGGYVEQKNSIGKIGREQGFVTANELADACVASSEMALQKSACAERLAEVQRRLLRFRSELRAEEAETTALCSQLAEERRRSNEWWEWHMARLPEYHKDLESLRQTEAFARTMQMNKQACLQRLRSQRSDEELAEEELRLTRQAVEKSEGEIGFQLYHVLLWGL